jgi:hypothetical protein
MTRSIPFAAIWLTVFAWGLMSHPAQAEPPAAKAGAVYVLSIWTEDSDDQAEALTRALRWRVRQAPGWSLLETNQSFETLAIALKCPPKPDPACLLRIGDQLKTDHYVWGTMDKKKGPAGPTGPTGEVSAVVHLWTRGRPSAEARETFSDSLRDSSDDSLRAIASEFFGQLTGAGSSTATAASTVVEEPEASSRAPSQPARASATESEQRFSTRTALAYSALALGVGFLAAGGVEAANWIGDKNASSDDRKVISASVTDVCADRMDAAAIDACNKSHDAVTASTLAWIFAGVGAALVGTGVWLITTDHPSTDAGSRETSRAPKPPIALLPSFGPGAGSIDVRATF